MNDNQFLNKMQTKIETLTGKPISLVIDESETDRLEVEPGNEIPKVIIGSAALKYPGFARMCIEYAVASIRQGRRISTLEFHVVLGRN
jgi:hypothetical protein